MPTKRDLVAWLVKNVERPDGEEFHKVGVAARAQGVPWQTASKGLVTRLEKSLAVWSGPSETVGDAAATLRPTLPATPGKAEWLEPAKWLDHDARPVGPIRNPRTLVEFQQQAKGRRDGFCTLMIPDEKTRLAIGTPVP